MKPIYSHNELTAKLGHDKKTFVLLYKSTGAEQNACAKANIETAESNQDRMEVLYADVSEVNDIHTHYNVTSVPVLLEFNAGRFSKVVKGCHPASFYENVFSGVSVSSAQNTKNNAPQKNVVVYSTPTCSWCNTLKNYLKDHKIKFSDIDVSQDTKAAEEMVRRSGQQGVPQTVINGQLIVGFDKGRMDKLLDIQSK